MSVNSINAYHMSLTDFIATPAEEDENSPRSSLLTQSARNSAYAAYGADLLSGPGQEAMKRALEELQSRSGGPVTFERVREYRAELEKNFTLQVQGGLFLLGVTECDDFQLAATPEGEIEILSQEPALKEKLETLFAENPELKEQFLYIQALGNIERAGQSLSPRLRQQAALADLGAQAVNIFMEAASSKGAGYSSLLGNFNGAEGSMQFLLGANLTV
ncbi:MAG: hypothetical protein LBQ63_07320 [Deltaproteobacteria bacterium]|nr:hypothetical protein [Deltaproteobacteria bacterium]